MYGYHSYAQSACAFIIWHMCLLENDTTSQFRQKHILSAETASRSTMSSHPRRKSRLRSSVSLASMKPTSIHANTYANVIVRIGMYSYPHLLLREGIS